MDVGLYISDLLKQDGEIIVPGLGFLVQQRMAAYYNAGEGKFYPPHHQVNFNPQAFEDDTLSQHIAAQKNISLSSAQYFTEKYIDNLKHDALTGDVAVADLGWFYTKNDAIAFKSNAKLTESTALFALEPVEIQKQRSLSFTQQPTISRPVQQEEDSLPGITFTSRSDKPVQLEDEDRFPSVIQLEKVFEEEKKNSLVLLYVAITIVLLAIVGLAVIYKFSPKTFEDIRLWEYKIRGKKLDTAVEKPIVKEVVKIDTARDSSGVDPSTLANVLPKDPTIIEQRQLVLTPEEKKSAEVKTQLAAKAEAAQKANHTIPSYFEVIAQTTNTVAETNSVIARLRIDGVNAVVSGSSSGSLTDISTGAKYDTREEAEAARIKLIADHKISSNTSSVKEIKQQ